MKSQYIRILIFTGILFISLNGFAQHKHFKHHKPKNRYHNKHLMYINNIRVTGMLGLSSYYGDLCDQTVCFRYRPGLTIGAYYRYSGRLSFRGDFTYLRLAGNDADGINKRRNLSFRSPNLELAVGVNYDLIYFERNWHLRAQYIPYLFAQIGVLYYNPKAQIDGQWYSLRSLQTEGNKYNSLTVSLPLGAGLRYKINSYMDISFEFAYRKTFSDYLDDVSTVYKDNSSFSDPIAAALADRTFEGGYSLNSEKSDDGTHWNGGHKRGNPSRKDGFFMFGFKFEYMIKATKQLHSINSMPRYRHRNSGLHRKLR